MDYNYTPEQNNRGGTGKGFSVSALVLGIVGIVFGFIPALSIAAFVCALLGLIFGIVGRKKSKAALGRSSGVATAGFVLGIIGTAFSALGVLCTLACVGTAVGTAGAFGSLFN